MSALTFHYFNSRALGELSRLTLVLADVKFEDKRYDFSYDTAGPVPSQEFVELKSSAKLPFGQVPILDVKDGDSEKITTLAQCHAIARYIAREYGLFGKTNLEGALIDAITEHVRDGIAAYMKVKNAPSTNQSINQSDKNTPTHSDDKSKYFTEYLPTHFARLND